MELFKLFGTIAINNSDANSEIDATSGKAESAGSKIGSAFSKIGSMVGTVAKVSAAAMGVAVTGIAALTKAAIDDYAEYEQLVGGVETLFKDSSDQVVQYANNAYKTAGLSANEYMETVTSFSASLLQSLDGDTAAAAEKADLAITDMSDNANKMGTSMESIQNAYQGFAKQNYTMLDNLKLGYGGTKEEMERLLQDATALSGVEYDISSYADIVDAIHVVQDNLGITGTTAKEASTTIQGSITSMKASWENFLTGMSDDSQDFDALLGNLIDSVMTVADNLVPRIAETVPRLVEGVTGLVQTLSGYIPDILGQLLPSLIDGATSIIDGFLEVLPDLINLVVETLPQFLDGVVQIFTGIVEALPEVFDMLVQALPDLITLLVDALPDLIPTIVEALVQMVVVIAENLPEIIQALIDALPTIILTLSQTIIDNAPTLLLAVVSIIGTIVAALPKLFNLIVNLIPQLIGQIKAKFSSKFNEFKSYAAGLITGAIDGFKEKVESMKESILGKFDTLKEKISSIIEKIKGFFSFTFDIPSIKLPHFSITPSGWKLSDLLKGDIPSLGIEWYAKAMDNPMVMTQPTAFGVNGNGQIMAGGEAGSEVVSGTDTLMGMISQAVAAQNVDLIAVLSKILVAILNMDDNMGGNMREALAGTSFQVNNREFARLVKAVN